MKKIRIKVSKAKGWVVHYFSEISYQELVQTCSIILFSLYIIVIKAHSDVCITNQNKNICNDQGWAKLSANPKTRHIRSDPIRKLGYPIFII